jgi:hypothetical protein
LELKSELNYRILGSSRSFFFRLLKRKNINNKLITRIKRVATISTGNVAVSNPLPSGTPSPELGADPGLIAAVVPQNMLVNTKSSVAVTTILFNLFSPLMISFYL